MKWRFGIIGGDRRQAELARMLAQDGHFVTTYGLDSGENMLKGRLEQALSADVVILPLPLCAKPGMITCAAEEIPVEALLEQLQPTQLILGGRVKAEEQRMAQARGLQLRDYFLREELTVANAAATAEGTVQVILERMDRSLLGSRCLVLGFGRIGKLLSRRLAAMGAQVTAAARRPAQRALAESLGLRSVPIDRLGQIASAFDTVVNTVPAPVLSEAVLARLRPQSFIVDLASRPGGTDFDAARRLGHRAIHALSLPAACAPETAGEAVARTVCDMIGQREEAS